MNNPSIAIAGAGIGGLTVAVALKRVGLTATVYEQAPELGEVGAGLTITPNATRVLDGLGLEAAMAAMADATAHVGALDSKTGERVEYTPRGAEVYLKAYGAVTRHVHRADLHDVLMDALQPHANQIHTDHQLQTVEQTTNGIELGFANGNTAHCDVLIGCDGIKSAVRDALFPTEPPQFTGYVAWRAVVDRDRAPRVNLDPHFASYVADGKMFARYPLRHGKVINCVAMARRDSAGEESWTARDDVENVLQEFAGWHQDVIDIIKAIPADGCFRWSLHTRKALDSWINGRVTLLGDAAHPMTPFLGMGAAMAIEDATVLGRCFGKYAPDWDAALAAYQATRLEYGNAVFARSIIQGERLFGTGASEHHRSPGFGLEDLYRYDALSVEI
ncbi:MAG: FAD-dependent monooxygenase [Gammaproteobacteria bacterium]